MAAAEGVGGQALETDAPADEEGPATKGERTRRRLLEIAIGLFGQHGYRGTSVSEICRQAGLTQAASYAYFDSKDHLFRAAVDADARSLVEQAQAATEHTPARELVGAFLVHLAAGLEGHPLARRVLAGGEPDAGRQLRRLETLRQINADLARRFADGQARGEVRSDVDPVALAQGAQTITLSLLMSMLQWNDPGGAAEEEDDDGRVADEVIVGVLAVFDAMLAPEA